MPDMTPTRHPGTIYNGWMHFYFHKAGVSYAEAYADFAECYRFLPGEKFYALTPAFAPWGERAGGVPLQMRNNSGLIGGLIVGAVQGPLQRRDRQSRMRRCMEPRGYLRYPLEEGVWHALIDNYSERSIAMQAIAASGPSPGLEPVTR